MPYSFTNQVKSAPRVLTLLIIAALGIHHSVFAADDNIQFNTDILDAQDRSNIDLSQFSKAGYIMPGQYNMALNINDQPLPSQPLNFYVPDNDPKGSQPCLTEDMVKQLGLKSSYAKQLTWWHKGQCADLSSLKGITSRGDLASSTLYVQIPLSYMEYTAQDWDPPARWDNGVPGVLFDYNFDAQANHQEQGGSDTDLSGNGVAGGNLGAWRLRADWQMQDDHRSDGSAQRSWDWSRYYAYRALPSLGAKLTLGEHYWSSTMFDQFRFTGASLVSDDSMLPPNLRGYAPEVRGIARTNAKVIVSQQGRVIYQTQVAAGPFRIQDLNQATSGKLDVKVQEQDGSVQTYQVNTANVPYLTRPGSVRYKLALGKPSDMETHHTQGPNFATGEFSWGVSNGWSLFGGGLAAGDYNAASLGVGRDLLAFGAVSLTATESDARLSDEGSLHGGSYQLSYSKNFDQTDSNITFAGYRFSQRNYMNMSTYLAHRRGQDHALGSDKEMYTVTFDQGIPRVFANVYISYSHQTYWNHPESDSYSIALSRSFDLGSFHDINIEGSVSHNNEYGKNEDIGYVSLTVPWGENRSLSYNANISRHNTTQTVGYSQQIDDRTGIQVNAGTSRNGGTFSGNVDYRGDMAEVNGNANYEEGVYSSVGGSVEGGMTLTANGGALHRQSEQGGTRLMVDTDGVADVPVRGFGTDTHSNHFGKAVIDDISNYSRSEASVDIDHLGNNVEATQSTTEATLTEGAIGYRRFNVIGGQKSMAVIRLADGSTPPFGATVSNLRKQDTGIVSDAGSVYLSGIQPDEKMKVQWGSKTQCTVTLPHTLPAEAMSTTLLLPCS